MKSEPKILDRGSMASSINGVGKLDNHMQRIKLEFCLTSLTKVNSKWIKDLNMSSETIEISEENIGGKLPNIGPQNEFLNVMPKAQAAKARVKKCPTSNYQASQSKRSKQKKKN